MLERPLLSGGLVLFLIFVVVIFIGCGVINYQTVPYEGSLCDNRDLAIQYGLPEHLKLTESWMCEAAQKANYSLEDLDDLILDASAVTAIMARVDRMKIGAFLNRVENYLDLNLEQLTYSMLIEYIYAEAERPEDAMLLSAVLSRRINIFSSDSKISTFDVWLIKKHFQHQRQQFGLYL